MTPEPRSSVRWQRRCSRLQVGAGDLGGVALGSSRRIGCLSSLAASLRSAAALALPAPPFNPPPSCRWTPALRLVLSPPLPHVFGFLQLPAWVRPFGLIALSREVSRPSSADPPPLSCCAARQGATR